MIFHLLLLFIDLQGFKILDYSYRQNKSDNLCLSGGCAMNSVANGKIILNTNDYDPYLRGMFNWVGFKQITIDYERGPRSKGETKFKLLDILTFKTLNPWREVVRGITSFSLVPLYLPLIAGFIMSIISFFLIIYFFLQKLFIDEVTSGWTSLFLAVLLIGGLILIILGTIGIYIGKMFEILRGRPKYIVQDTINIEKKND